MNFDLMYCLQPVPRWCEKQFFFEERIIFESIDKQELRPNDILKQILLKTTGDVYGKVIASFLQ